MCAIYGAIGFGDMRDEALGGIELLQHRGQEAAGIFLQDNAADQHYLIKRTGGLALLPPEKINTARGEIALAHLRYATTKGDGKLNAQPFWTDDGNIGFVHNGQVQNMSQLRAMLTAKGKKLISDSDGELLLKTFASFYTEANGSLEERVFSAVRQTQAAAIGGYACLLSIYGVGLLAFRDPWGIRPLVMGRKENGDGPVIAFASESRPLQKKGYSQIEDIAHGSAVLVTPDLNISTAVLEQYARRNCGLEYPYFAHSSSTMEGAKVNTVRYDLGRIMAKKCQDRWGDFDMVVPIPETPRPAASGFAAESGILYKDVIYKSRYAQRIFITPDQEKRELKAEEAFDYDEEAFEGKNVLLVDDSIVRGTVSKAVIRHVRSFGANSVHMALTFGRITHPCSLGIDMPDGLIAVGKSDSQIAKAIGADSVLYASVEDVYSAIGSKELCTGCVTGEYPTGLIRIQ